MKILLVANCMSFSSTVKQILNKSVLGHNLLHYSTESEAIHAVTGEDSDFDILILNDDLALFGEGLKVLNVLSKQQIQKTIFATSEGSTKVEASEMGVSVFMCNLFYEGTKASKLDKYVLDKIEFVQSKN